MMTVYLMEYLAQAARRVENVAKSKVALGVVEAPCPMLSETKKFALFEKRVNKI